MILYLYFALMMAVSVLWLMWFWRRPLTSNLFNLQKSNIALAQQKQAELQVDLTQGLIDDVAFNDAQDEIAKTLAIELSKDSTDVGAIRQNSAIWLGLVAVLIVVFSLGLYQALSSKPSIKSSAPTLDAQIMPLDLKSSVIRLQSHLLDKPDDALAWQMLGLTYFELNDLDGSLQAYEESYQLNPNNPRLLVEYASTIAIKNNNDFSGRPIQLVKRALEIDPNAADALYMAGLYAVSHRDFSLAQKLWQRAMSVLPPDSADRAVLAEVLAELSGLLKEGEAQIKKLSITVHVDFAGKVLASRSDDDYLMVYAKPAKGRAMPIAIQKIRLKDFDGQLVLDDSHSVVPNNKLSQASEVIIVARLSRSGAAFKQADDIQVSSEVIQVDGRPTVHLQIK